MELTNIFKALSDQNRFKILQMVARQEMCVCDLTEAFRLTQPTISHHLKVLAEAGLITVEKRGKWCFYTLNQQSIRNLHDLLDKVLFHDEVVLHLCDSSCDGLRRNKKGKEV
ncbi:MAG: winged helix-turn-helix transcriptional regulator [Peptococcaceae bacterium]|jgi:ArsR family transcriptional regulator|nr:winged helix-turn-helix transcriptional regulator [Peptococcaceae bacterium]